MENTGNEEWYYWRSRDGKTRRSKRYSWDDRIRGECSGIPACCVTFFVDHWQITGRFLSPLQSEHWNRIEETRKRLHLRFDEPGYIPCPSCLEAGKFVEVRSCEGAHCFCGKWANSEAVEDELVSFSQYLRVHKKYRKMRRRKRKQRCGYA